MLFSLAIVADRDLQTNEVTELYTEYLWKLFWGKFLLFLNVSFGVLHFLFTCSAIHVSFIKRWHHFIAINNDVIDWKLDPIQKSQA